jgi:RsiW-degrading membrane proteinase PrsW (M82 family)
MSAQAPAQFPLQPQFQPQPQTSAPFGQAGYGYPPAAIADSRGGGMRSVLLICVLMTICYAVQVLFDVIRPHVPGEPVHPLIGWLGPDDDGWWQKASFWTFVVAIPVAALISLIGWQEAHRRMHPAERDRVTRIWQAIASGVLLLPYVYTTADVFAGNLRFAATCVPSAAYALWLAHRMQRFRRIPVRILLAVFGWGAVIGVGFGDAMETWWADYSPDYLALPLLGGGEQAIEKLTIELYDGEILFAGVFEELGKGIAVAFVYLLLRRHIDNVVSGIVLGAAAGVGFNLVESTIYMGSLGGQTASEQYFLRQSLGMLAAHVAFTAAIGAGFGIARQLPDQRRRALAIACGFATAMAGHFANDVFMSFYSRVKENWFSPSNATDILVYTPLAFAVLQGPLVVLYLVLLRRGLRDQAAALAVELGTEAATGFGAVTQWEVPVLLRPARRFYLCLTALRQGGLVGYRDLRRLFAAQLDLGMARWHRTRGEIVPGSDDEQSLRRRIAQLRYQIDQRTAMRAAPAQPFGVIS